MNSKERLTRAIEFRNPDRVPYMGTNTIMGPLTSDVFPIAPFPNKDWQPRDSPPNYPHIEPILMNLGLYKWDTSRWNPPPPRKWSKVERMEVDEWGSYWYCLANDNTMGHPSKPAIDSWDELDKVHVPSTGWDRFKTMNKLGKLFPGRYKLGMMENFLFERSHFIRGFTKIIVDYRKNPERVTELINMIKPFYLNMVKQYYRCGCDGIIAPDDLGTQYSAIVSPIVFNKFYREAYAEVIDLCHKLGMHFILHSCGNINALIPILVEIGLDGLQFDSPHMVGLDFAKQFHGKISFWNTVNIQSIYPFGTVRDVYKEVIRMIKAVGARNGGLVIVDYFGAPKVMNVPMANVKAMWEAVRVYGKYKKNGESILI